MFTFFVITGILIFLLAIVLPAKIKQKSNEHGAKRNAIALLNSISKEEYSNDPINFFLTHHKSLGPISFNDFQKLAARKGWN